MHVERRKFLKICGLTILGAGQAWAQQDCNTKGSVTISNHTSEMIFIGIRSETKAHDEHYIGWYGIEAGSAGKVGIHLPADSVWLCRTGWNKEHWPGQKVIPVTKETLKKVGRAKFALPIQAALDKNETLWFANVGLQTGGAFTFK